MINVEKNNMWYIDSFENLFYIKNIRHGYDY